MTLAPMVRGLPLGGLDTSDATTPLSVAVASGQVTVAVPLPGSVNSVLALGQVKFGLTLSGRGGNNESC